MRPKWKNIPNINEKIYYNNNRKHEQNIFVTIQFHVRGHP